MKKDFLETIEEKLEKGGLFAENKDVPMNTVIAEETKDQVASRIQYALEDLKNMRDLRWDVESAFNKEGKGGETFESVKKPLEYQYDKKKKEILECAKKFSSLKKSALFPTDTVECSCCEEEHKKTKEECSWGVKYGLESLKRIMDLKWTVEDCFKENKSDFEMVKKVLEYKYNKCKNEILESAREFNKMKKSAEMSEIIDVLEKVGFEEAKVNVRIPEGKPSKTGIVDKVLSDKQTQKKAEASAMKEKKKEDKEKKTDKALRSMNDSQMHQFATYMAMKGRGAIKDVKKSWSGSEAVLSKAIIAGNGQWELKKASFETDENKTIYLEVAEELIKSHGASPESVYSVEVERLVKAYVGFKKLVNKLKGKKGTEDAKAIAGAIAQKKYGKKKVAKYAAAGKSMKNAKPVKKGE